MTAIIESSAETTASATTIAATKPSGVVDGSAMVAVVTMDHGNRDPTTVPSGWTEIENVTTGAAGGDVRCIVYTRIAGASEPSTYTWGHSSTEQWGVVIFRLSGFDTSTLVDVSATATDTTNVTTHTSAAVTTTVDDCLILRCAAYDRGTDDVVTVPSGETEQANFGQFTGAAHQTIVSSSTQASAGSTGTGDFTSAGTAEEWASVTLAIRPAATGGGSVASPYYYQKLAG